jgi:polyphenol oxidase
VGNNLPAETFPALVRQSGLAHCFTQRVAGIDVTHDKTEALRRLDRIHREIRIAFGMGEMPLLTAEQIHGSEIAVIENSVREDKCFPGCDGLITNQRGVSLGIYVADCCAVYLFDAVRSAIGLVHSGKKGTALGIAARAITLMSERFGTSPNDIVVQLSPCIRPPHYEVDFAADIIRACQKSGVQNVHDSKVCTACHLDRYYSYRAEKGKTGRMLALLAMR